MPDRRLALYDAHAPRLFALALRITGDEAEAASVLEEVFTAKALPSEFADLVRRTREIALSRDIRSEPTPVGTQRLEPSPRQLVEDAFYRGMSVADLASAWNVPAETVRRLLRDGMLELREQLSAEGTKR